MMDPKTAKAALARIEDLEEENENLKMKNKKKEPGISDAPTGKEVAVYRRAHTVMDSISPSRVPEGAVEVDRTMLSSYWEVEVDPSDKETISQLTRQGFTLKKNS